MAATLAAQPRRTPVIAVLAVIWIPWNLAQLRKKRRETLAIDAENRAYVFALVDFARKSSTTRVFVYDGQPSSLHPWGIDGTLRYLFGHPNPELYSIEDKQAATALQRDDVALLKWNPNERKLDVISNKTEEPYLAMNRQTPPWQLRSGWYSQEEGFRWIAPHASARLAHPDSVHDFELVVNISPDHIKETGPIAVTVVLNGAEIGKRKFTSNGIQTCRWPAPRPIQSRDSNEAVTVDFDVAPEYHPANGDSRRLGIAVVAFGFR